MYVCLELYLFISVVNKREKITLAEGKQKWILLTAACESDAELRARLHFALSFFVCSEDTLELSPSVSLLMISVFIHLSQYYSLCQVPPFEFWLRTTWLMFHAVAVKTVGSSFWETQLLSGVTVQLGLQGFVREGLGWPDELKTEENVWSLVYTYENFDRNSMKSVSQRWSWAH